MDYATIFKNSARTIWRHKPLVALGLLLMAGSIPGILAGHLYARFWLSSFAEISTTGNPQEIFEPVVDLLLNPAVLIGGTISIFLVFILIWIVSTIGEAALIQGVADFHDDRARSLGDLLSAGVKLLARIIAIDTVIFLPLFLILLVQLLVLGGGMIGGVLLISRPGATPQDLLPVGVIVGLVLLFLTVLLVPVAILTMMFRLIAFRSAVLEDLPTRPSIRRAWELIRAKLGQIIIVFLLLYAVSYAIGMVTSLLVLPFSFGGTLFFIIPAMQGPGPQFGNMEGFLTLITLASIVALLPNLLYRVYYSAVWTLSYREWQRKP